MKKYKILMLAAAIQVLIVSNLLADVAEKYKKNGCEAYVGPGPHCYCYYIYYDSNGNGEEDFYEARSGSYCKLTNVGYWLCYSDSDCAPRPPVDK